MMARRQDSYYSRSQDNLNRIQNLALRSQEKVYEDFEVATPRDLIAYESPVGEERDTTPTYSTQTAPTTNNDRPRALKMAYSRQAKKLVVKFRDGTWWEYNDIPLRMWVGLKSSDSTGKYLKHSGLDTHDDMGPFNPSEMTEETRVLFNS